MKQITPNSQTLEAITKHGATSMLWVINLPFEDGITSFEKSDNTNLWFAIKGDELITSVIPPLQVDDEFYIAEECIHAEKSGFISYKIDAINALRNDLTDEEKFDFNSIKWQPASEMTESISRFKGKTLSVEVKRVQDLTIADIDNLKVACFKDYVNDAIEWFESIIGIGYNSNPLVGLINFKEKG